MLVRSALGILGLLVVVAVGRDVVATVVTSRAKKHLSPAQLSYRLTWGAYRRIAGRIADPTARERFLVPFGPASLVGLLAVWVVLLVAGWGLTWWSLYGHVHGLHTIWSGIFFSGVTFLTIGFGDLVPVSGVTRMLTLAEGRMGCSPRRW